MYNLGTRTETFIELFYRDGKMSLEVLMTMLPNNLKEKDFIFVS